MTTAPATRPVNLTLVELHAALRHLRNVKKDIQDALHLLQEQQRVGHDGHRNAASLVLDGELHVIEEVTRKLWEAVAAPAIAMAPPEPPPPAPAGGTGPPPTHGDWKPTK